MKKDVDHHDKSYKNLLSKKGNFLSLLRRFIKKSWVKKIDENDITLLEEGFVDPFFDEAESDMIYKISIADTEIYFYVLFELQSTVDYTLPMRLDYYVARIRRRIFLDATKNKQEKSDFKIPVVIPIVFYNGSEDWIPKKSFAEYQQGYEFFDCETLTNFNYILVDSNKVSSEKWD